MTFCVRWSSVTQIRLWNWVTTDYRFEKELFDEWWGKTKFACLVRLEIYYHKIGHFKILLIEVWCYQPYLSFFFGLSSCLSVRQTAETQDSPRLCLGVFRDVRKTMLYEVAHFLWVVFLRFGFLFFPSLFYIFLNKTKWLKSLWSE